jgi:hypothetical protein
MLGQRRPGTTRRRLRRGETLFRKGEPSTGFHAVARGPIVLVARSAQGRERVSAIINAGRSFGEAIMFLEKPYIVSARALSDALVLHVFGELERNPGCTRSARAAGDSPPGCWPSRSHRGPSAPGVARAVPQ